MDYYWWWLLALGVWIFIGAIKLTHLEREEKLPGWPLHHPRNGPRRGWPVRLAIVLLWPWLR
jgi:hypothetical protein